MKIALCQINTTVADFGGNARKILDFTGRAARGGAHLALFPELAVTGYPPKDLLLRSDFVAGAMKALKDIARLAPIPMLVGTVIRNMAGVGKPLHNVAAFLQDGRIKTFAPKMLIPTYDVFDEARYFEPAKTPTLIRIGGKRIGVTICEDLWNDRDFWPRRHYFVDPVSMLRKKGFDVLVNLSASPFELGKVKLRHKMLKAAAKKYGRPVFQVNLVGGNDDILFDGNSLAIDAVGRLMARGKAFAEDMRVVDSGAQTDRSSLDKLGMSGGIGTSGKAEEAHEALVMGVRDYAGKTGFRSAVLGLSGGIDSSVTACVAAEALGPQNVLGVLMPGPYSSKGSVEDSRKLAEALGMTTRVISIVPMVRASLKTLRPVFAGRRPDVTEENIQARVRGMILMAISNKFGHLLLTTGNKSEMSVGYCTLYGDMCGGLAVISDVPKMLVYGIGRHINRIRPIIPKSVFTKAPSAELRPNQTDQDSLPPYPVLDAFIEAYVERLTPPGRMRISKMRRSDIQMWANKIDAAEYKRRQAPPGLKITSRAFGAGRREPIARKIDGRRL